MAASTSVITRVDGRCITVNEVSYIYLFKINDRSTQNTQIIRKRTKRKKNKQTNRK